MLRRASSTKRTVVIDVGERLVRAVEVQPDGRGGAAVLKAVVIERPAAPGTDDEREGPIRAEELGRLIADTCRAGGFGGGDAIVVLARDLATIRRLEVPSVDDAELPEMVRLAVVRESALDPASLVVDLVPRERGEAATTVLVTAADRRGVDAAVRGCEEAGWRAAAVTLRTFGTARLLAEMEPPGPDGTGGGIVGIDCCGDALELVVVRGGELRHSRGVRLPEGDSAAVREAALSEAKRSWMGYRFSQPGAASDGGDAVARAVVFGDAETRQALIDGLGKVVGVAIEPFAPPPAIRAAAVTGDPPNDPPIDVAWPLVGVAIEVLSEGESINLAAPRKAPDLAARRRTRALLAVGVLLVTGLAAWTLGHRSRNALALRVEDLREKATGALPEHDRYKRDALKLEHLKTWASVGPEWLEHARFLHGFAADPKRVVLDSWVGTLDVSDVQYGRDRAFAVRSDLRIVLDGEAKDRAAADGFRDSLVDDGSYALSSTGADTEGGRRLGSPFSYVLRTGRPQPPAEGKVAAPAADAAAQPAKEAAP